MNFKPCQYPAYFTEAEKIKQQQLEAEGWAHAQLNCMKIRFDGHNNVLQRLSNDFDSKYANKTVNNLFNEACQPYLANTCLTVSVEIQIKKHLTVFEIERTRILDIHNKKAQAAKARLERDTQKQDSTSSTPNKEEESVIESLRAEVERLNARLEKVEKPPPPQPTTGHTPKQPRRSKSKERSASPPSDGDYVPMPYNPNKYVVRGNYRGKNYDPQFVKDEGHTPAEKTSKTWSKESRHTSGQNKEQTAHPPEERGRSRTRNEEDEGWSTAGPKKSTSKGRSASSNSGQNTLQAKSNNTPKNNNRVVELTSKGVAQEK